MAVDMSAPFLQVEPLVELTPPLLPTSNTWGSVQQVARLLLKLGSSAVGRCSVLEAAGAAKGQAMRFSNREAERVPAFDPFSRRSTR